MPLGNYDDRTDWRDTGLDDAEIARRLQIAEENPYEEKIEERRPATAEAWSAAARMQPQLEQIKDDYIDELRVKAADVDYERAEARRAKDEIRREKAELDRERKLRIEAEKKARAPRYVEKTIPAVRKLYDLGLGLGVGLGDISYKKWYDYIPSWYGPFERRRLQTIINRLLEKELKTTSDYEMEEKIKKLIEEAAAKEKSKKSPRKARTPKRRSPRHSPRRKSPRRISPKRKSPRRRTSPKRR
jgi:penicillin-insensitive murein endopeptidase